MLSPVSYTEMPMCTVSSRPALMSRQTDVRRVPAATVLQQHGLSLTKTIPLDPAHGVEMTVWRRAP